MSEEQIQEILEKDRLQNVVYEFINERRQLEIIIGAMKLLSKDKKFLEMCKTIDSIMKIK